MVLPDLSLDTLGLFLFCLCLSSWFLVLYAEGLSLINLLLNIDSSFQSQLCHPAPRKLSLFTLLYCRRDWGPALSFPHTPCFPVTCTSHTEFPSSQEAWISEWIWQFQAETKVNHWASDSWLKDILCHQTSHVLWKPQALGFSSRTGRNDLTLNWFSNNFRTNREGKRHTFRDTSRQILSSKMETQGVSLRAEA